MRLFGCHFLPSREQLMQHLLKVMCTNTAWQRRKLGRVILDWANLLQEVRNTLKEEVI
jgi:hypothetical protein